MPKQVKVEGKVITVPDDATPDEIDQISSESKPSKFSQMVSNIPSSLKSTLLHPVAYPVTPSNDEGNIPAGEKYKGYTLEDFKQSTLPKIKSFMHAPIDSTVDTVVKNPVQSALTVAALGRGAFPETAQNVEHIVGGAIKGGVQSGMQPSDLFGFGRKLPVPVPRALAGAIEGHIGGRYFGHPEIGAALGASAPIIKGAYAGGKAALNDLRAAKLADQAPKIPDWMKENVSKVEDIPVGPIERPVLPSGRKVGPVQPVEQPTASAQTLPVQPLKPTAGVAAGNAPEALQPAGQKPVMPNMPSNDPNVIYDFENQPVVKKGTEVPNSEVPDPLESYKAQEQINSEIRARNALNKDQDLVRHLKDQGITKEQFQAMTPENRSALAKDIKHEETTYYPPEHPTKSGKIMNLKGRSKYTGFNEGRLNQFLDLWKD